MQLFCLSHNFVDILICLSAGPGECAIVNIASIAAHRAQPTRWSYPASKGAVSAMTRSMALDLSADGIGVSPAWIWTPAVSVDC